MPVPVESKEAALLELVFPFISFACFDIAQVSMGSYFLPGVPGFIVNDSSRPFGWIHLLQCLAAIIRDLGFTIEEDPSDLSPFVLFLSYSSVVVAQLLFFFFFAGMDHSFSGLLLVDLNSYILVHFQCGGPNQFIFIFAMI
jgi:hypothetical protein